MRSSTHQPQAVRRTRFPIAQLAGFCIGSLMALAANADTTTVSVENTEATVTNGAATSLSFVIKRYGETNDAVAVQYATANGSAIAGTDYTGAAGTAIIPAGTASIKVSVPVTGEAASQPDKTMSLNLQGAVATGPTPTFTLASDPAAGSRPQAVASADINGDGKPDLIITDEGNGSVAVLLHGTSAAGFGTGTLFGAGQTPQSVAVGDLNGDGRPDIVTANEGDGTISILINATTPGASVPAFKPAYNLVLAPANFVRLADVNNDGRPDLIVVGGGSDVVSVFINATKPGTTTPIFVAARTFATAAGPFSVNVADINHDGRLDLIVPADGSNMVSVLLNTTTPGSTTATFSTQQSFATGSLPLSADAADFNGDGKPDLVVVNGSSSTVQVYRNLTSPGATSASFATAITLPADVYPDSVVATDINGDGRADLVVANSGSGTLDTYANITAPGATTLGFAPRSSIATGGRNPYSVIASDINGDGRPDAVVANLGSDTVSVMLNGLAGTAQAALDFSSQQVASQAYAYQTLAADLNGDGKPDLVAWTGDVLTVQLDNSSPGASGASFSAKQTVVSSSSGRGFAAVADLNGDGRPDLLIPSVTAGYFSVLMNTTPPGAATVSFTAAQDFPDGVGAEAFHFATADLNGDGKPDVVIDMHTSSVSYLGVLLNKTLPGSSTASFATSLALTNYGGSSIAIADFNGDGKPDLASANPGDTGELSVFLNSTAPGATAPSFGTRSIYAGAGGGVLSNVHAADVNGDGRPDLVATDGTHGGFQVLLNTTAAGNSPATFATGQLVSNLGSAGDPDAIAVTDIDGDGRADVVLPGGSDSVIVAVNTTAAGSTSVSFAANTFATIGTSGAVAVADFNTDGAPDLALTNDSGTNVSILTSLQFARAINQASGLGTIHYHNAPAAPRGVAPGSVARGSFTLSWAASMGATSYNVYVGPSPGHESTTPSKTGITGTSVLLTAPPSGTTSYYKVAAVNAYGISPLSAEVQVTTP